MATSTRKSSTDRSSAQKRAAEKAEEAAEVLHSFAATLNSLDALTPASRHRTPTPRNWWHLQAGRFKDDPTFPDFVTQVQAARRREG
jgi:beta-phosphoglucomutase-like phosphatase (HAD superfamily)